MDLAAGAGGARDRLVVLAAHQERDAGGDRVATAHAARVVVGDARDARGVLFEAVEVLEVEQPDRRAAHHAAVAGRLAIGIFPRQRARLRGRLARAQVEQRRAGEVAHVLGVAVEPAQVVLRDLIEIDLAPRGRAHQRQRQLDVVGRLARFPRAAGDDLGRRRERARLLELERRAERLAHREAGERA